MGEFNKACWIYFHVTRSVIHLSVTDSERGSDFFEVLSGRVVVREPRNGTANLG